MGRVGQKVAMSVVLFAPSRNTHFRRSCRPLVEDRVPNIGLGWHNFQKMGGSNFFPRLLKRAVLDLPPKHPIPEVLLSASVERVGVSRMRDLKKIFYQSGFGSGQVWTLDKMVKKVHVPQHSEKVETFSFRWGERGKAHTFSTHICWDLEYSNKR